MWWWWVRWREEQMKFSQKKDLVHLFVSVDGVTGVQRWVSISSSATQDFHDGVSSVFMYTDSNNQSNHLRGGQTWSMSMQ